MWEPLVHSFANSGIVDTLSSAFGVVLNMLTGKKFPENVRALRILVENLIRPVIAQHSPESMYDLLKILEDASSKTRTAKLWVDRLIKPVFVIMRYIRAEQESDWELHLECVREMIPLFFVKEHFLKGELTIHLAEGLSN